VASDLNSCKHFSCFLKQGHQPFLACVSHDSESFLCQVLVSSCVFYDFGQRPSLYVLKHWVQDGISLLNSPVAKLILQQEWILAYAWQHEFKTGLLFKPMLRRRCSHELQHLQSVQRGFSNELVKYSDKLSILDCCTLCNARWSRPLAQLTLHRMVKMAHAMWYLTAMSPY